MKLYNTIPSNGITSRTSLLASGATRADIMESERLGGLIRVDRSRYAHSSIHPDVLAAAQAGATLTCLSALRVHGVATAPPNGLHLRRDRYSRRFRGSPDDLVCPLRGVDIRGPVDSLQTGLLAAIRNHEPEVVVTALDSILHQRILTRAELEPLVRGVGKAGHRSLSRADGRSESPLESIIRYRLQAHRIKVRPQVHVPGVGRVDFLVGNRLIIEADGREFHDSPSSDDTVSQSFHEDRRRDREATLQGFIVIRLTWYQVMYQWDAVEADILRLIRKRQHIR